MYAKRIKLIDYGPIKDLDINMPFIDGKPKPVVLVGENGTGKSIVLSQIVNGLIIAKDIAFPDSREVEINKVYKLRSNQYIRKGSPLYFVQIEFEDELTVRELRTIAVKNIGQTENSNPIPEIAMEVWDTMEAGQNDNFTHNMSTKEGKKNVEDVFGRNCVLYFPSDRYEHPAWLNLENITFQAHVDLNTRLAGSTSRRVVNYSSLAGNANYIYDLIYDRAAFETRTIHVPLGQANQGPRPNIPVLAAPEGIATDAYNLVLTVLRTIVGTSATIRFGIGPRRNRTVALMDADTEIVPNIFQLSSGEASLLNMFLNIIRDFDSSGTHFSNAADIRGIAVIDEIDLHLHTRHQYEILPQLIGMFPNVQFIVTTHSPLFLLGMQELLGDDGFSIYRMPESNQISPEEFSEFGEAYTTITDTQRYADDIRAKIIASQKPLLFVEGPTDEAYILTAATLLGKEDLLAQFNIEQGEGEGNLTKIWNNFKPVMQGLVPQDVILLYDPEMSHRVENESNNNLFRRVIPLRESHPIQKGIENLFERSILDNAKAFDKSFIDIKPGGFEIKDGVEIPFSEIWTASKRKKSDLCDWICANGIKEDFANFGLIFDILGEFIDADTMVTTSHLTPAPESPNGKYP